MCPAAIIVAFALSSLREKCRTQKLPAWVTVGQPVAMPSSTSVEASVRSDTLSVFDAAAVAATQATIATAVMISTFVDSSNSNSPQPSSSVMTNAMAASTAAEPARTTETASTVAPGNPDVAAQIIGPEQTPAQQKPIAEYCPHETKKTCLCNMQLLRKNLQTHLQHSTCPTLGKC